MTMRIIESPVNEYENCLNLKQVQQGLARMRINVPFEINKVSKQRYVENWNFVVLLFKALEGIEVKNGEERVLMKTPRKVQKEAPVSENKAILVENSNTVN